MGPPSSLPMGMRASAAGGGGGGGGGGIATASQSRRAHKPTFGSFQNRASRNASTAQGRQRNARTRRVILYRRYRRGELPDVQICWKDLVEPLAGLAAVDVEVSL